MTGMPSRASVRNRRLLSRYGCAGSIPRSTREILGGLTPSSFAMSEYGRRELLMASCVKAQSSSLVMYAGVSVIACFPTNTPMNDENMFFYPIYLVFLREILLQQYNRLYDASSIWDSFSPRIDDELFEFDTGHSSALDWMSGGK